MSLASWFVSRGRLAFGIALVRFCNEFRQCGVSGIDNLFVRASDDCPP